MESNKRKRVSASEAFALTQAKVQEDSQQLEDEIAIAGNAAEPNDAMGATRSLRAKARAAPPPTPSPPPYSSLVTSEELQLEKEPIKVRESGVWFWKWVVIPPNAYVVHTRMGRASPVTLGLGKSFRYNPYTDAYLVVPAAMQTIGVVANCITQEKQGINILAYLQWQIDDFAMAYQKLDFSDSRDPLGIVNAQLREQAEAAIKDKIATMSVEEVLTDKAPVIKELTMRLKSVAEGHHQDGKYTKEGLGIKIVTVQIREALVSSQKLWQDLQAPFRHEQEKAARISHLDMQNEVKQKELENWQVKETSQAETETAIQRVKQTKHTEALTLRLDEEAIRVKREHDAECQKVELQEKMQLEQQSSEQRLQAQGAAIAQEQALALLQREHDKAVVQQKLTTTANNQQQTLAIEQALHTLAEEARLSTTKNQAEQERIAQETELHKLTQGLNVLLQKHQDSLASQIQAAQLEREQAKQQAELALTLSRQQQAIDVRSKELALLREEQNIHNLINSADLLRRLIEELPYIVENLPDVDELKVLQSNGEDATFNTLTQLVAKILETAEYLGVPMLEKSNSAHQGE